MSDAYASYVVFHHHCNGNNNDIPSGDELGSALASTGTLPLISTTQSKFGGSSLKFIGSNICDITPSAQFSALFDFGTGDLTIEGWIYPTGNGSPLINCQKSSNLLNFYLDSSTSGRLLLGGANSITGIVFTANAWQHLAITRAGNTWRVFVEGVQGGTSTNSSAYALTSSVGLGGMSYGGHYFNGYVDEIRITKGVARYTSNFTPSATAFDNKFSSRTYLNNQNTFLLKSSHIDYASFTPTKVLSPITNPKDIIKNIDEQDGGTKKITGYVTFNQQPASRLVHLLVAQDKRWIAATWSDPTTGYYEFLNLKDIPYLVLAEDYTNTYDLVAHFVTNQS